MLETIPGKIEIEDLPYLLLVDKDKFPKCSCIYFAYLGETVLYVGRASNLLQRWRNHHRQADLDSFGTVKLAWLEVNNLHLLPAIEKVLIQYFKPLLNQHLIQIRKHKTELGKVSERRKKHLESHGFKPSGDAPLRRSPVSVKLPPKLDEFVRSQPNRNQWLIAAIEAAYQRELENQSA